VLGGPNAHLDCILPYIHNNPSVHKKKGPLEKGLLCESRFQSHVSQVLQYKLNDASHLIVLIFHVEDLLMELTKANKAHKVPHLGASGGPFALPWLLPHPVPPPGLLKSLQTWKAPKQFVVMPPIKQAYSSNKMNEIITRHTSSWELPPTHGKNALEHQKFQNHLLQGTNQSSLIPLK